MKPVFRCLPVVLAAALLSACTTPEAPGVRGKWRPVNGFAEEPRAIPLQESYVFRALPVDATLKTMLGRWARDRRMSLSYLHPNDYTLHGPVAQIRTSDVHQAVRALSDAYASQGLRVAVENNQIVVRAANATPTSES